MKIKFLTGKKKDQVVEVEDVQAKSYIDDAMAEEVKPVDSVEVALKSFEDKINDMITKGAGDAAKKAAADTLEKIGKGIAVKRIVVGNDQDLEDKTGGFKTMSHFLLDVKRSCAQKAPTEAMAKWVNTYEKLVKSTTGNTEGSTTNDAGYAVPVQYTSDIFSMYNPNIPDYASKSFQVPMQTNTIKIPVLKNYVRSNTTTSLGVVANTISESSNITQSKTNWEQISLSLTKEGIIVPVSDELVEDNNVALGSVVGEQAAYQIRKAKNGGIVAGSSAYTGIINHASTVVVKRQTTLVIGFTDIMNMYASFAFDDADFAGAEWFAHPTVLTQLGNLTSGNFNLYFPPGGIQDGAVGKLLGRPINITGWCNPVGQSGCLILADMKKYVSGYRNGLQSMVSPHVFFLTDELAYRFTERVAGRPGLSSPITLEDGTTTVSPFVQLGLTPGGS